MSEYRASIGRFAWVAKFASFRLRRSCKKPKLTKLKKEGENPQRPNLTKLKGSSGSLDRWTRREKSQDIGQRSNSWNQTREGRSRTRKPQISRTKSQSLVRVRKGIADNFKNSCIACKTDLFDQRRQRGRSTKTLRQSRQEPKQESCCSHPGKDDVIEGSQLKLFTCVAVSECFMLERAMIAVIQMLLVRSGIETNPGPTTTGDDSPCCNASQHFNRVKNTMAKAQNNFQSKVTQDTLSKKVIEIEETGDYAAIFFENSILRCENYKLCS